MRIRSCNVHHSFSTMSLSVVVLLHYGTNVLALLGVHPNTGCWWRGEHEPTCQAGPDSDTTEDVPRLGTIALPAAPIDCAFSADDSMLIVLLPAPHYMAVFQLTYHDNQSAVRAERPQITAQDIALDGSSENQYASAAFTFVSSAAAQGGRVICFCVVYAWCYTQMH